MRFTYLIVSLILWSLPLRAQWSQKASVYDYGRRSTFGCAVNGSGYTGCGAIYNGSYVNDFWKYDTTSNTWSQKADYPGAGKYENTAFSVNGKLYVCLGFSSSYVCQSDLWEYNPSNNSWLQKTSFPGNARYGARAFVINNKAFVVAGSYNNSSNYYSDMFMYDPATDSWTAKASFPGGSRAFGTAFSLGGFGYFGLGNSNSTTSTNDMYKYDPNNDSWSSIPNFPGQARNAPINFIINGKAHVGLGGNSNSSVCYNDFYVFNPAINNWETISTSSTIVPRTGCIAFSFGDKGYIGLGLNTVGVFTDLWEYNPRALADLEQMNTVGNLQVYPNPATDKITIIGFETSDTDCMLKITGIDGKVHLNRKIDFSIDNILDVSGFVNGNYFIQVENSTHSFIERILINRN